MAYSYMGWLKGVVQREIIQPMIFYIILVTVNIMMGGVPILLRGLLMIAERIC